MTSRPRDRRGPPPAVRPPPVAPPLAGAGASSLACCGARPGRRRRCGWSSSPTCWRSRRSRSTAPACSTRRGPRAAAASRGRAAGPGRPRRDRSPGSRRWPRSVASTSPGSGPTGPIDVTERVAVAVVEIGGRLRGMDAEGVVFRDYPGTRTGPARGAHTSRPAPTPCGRPRSWSRRCPRTCSGGSTTSRCSPSTRSPWCCATAARCCGGARRSPPPRPRCWPSCSSSRPGPTTSASPASRPDPSASGRPGRRSPAATLPADEGCRRGDRRGDRRDESRRSACRRDRPAVAPTVFCNARLT